ncbi:RidA family protein [Pseudomonas sp. H11T01]|uniref:RidA family protein n=1 Tax=Pseudomonas sp. H11T01 TaxID=3402749 RepID=UPI003AC2A03D
MQSDKQHAPTLQLSNPPGLYDPTANGYSHVAQVAAGARLVFIAGQGGENADSQLSSDFAEQVRQALDNLQIALAAAGAEVSDVAKLTVLIVDHSLERLEIFGEELHRVWGSAPKPACTLIPVPRLALDGMLFEIEAMAAVAV